MTNHAQRGRRMEQSVIDHLGERGYDCVRSAASKGAADIVAFHDREICLIQAKAGLPAPVSPAERRELLRIAGRIGAVPVTVFRRPDRDDGRRHVLVFHRLTGQGPKEFEEWTPREGLTDGH